MPRSFLVKKKTGVMGMPRPVSLSPATTITATRPGSTILPTASHTHLAGLPTPSIFSPAKLCTVESPVECYSPRSAPQTPERCCSRESTVSSSGSPPPEPLNYSLSSPRSAGSLTPTWSSSSSPSRLSPNPWTPMPSLSPSSSPEEMARLPFLALSFKRLQEMHMKAVESRLQGITMSPPRHPLPPSASPPYCPASPPAASPSSMHFTSGAAPSSPPMMSPISDARGDLNSLSPVLPPHGVMPHYTNDVTGFPCWSAARSPTGAATSERLPVTPMEVSAQPQPEVSTIAAMAALSAATPQKRKNGDPPRYQCEACNKSYATFSGLSKHKQFHCTALIKKEFMCKYCEKKYVSLGALKMHIRTHTLPCKCHICGKAFSRPWLLQGHVRTHTGEKPFPCTHCGRSFADRSNLRAHLQTHTDIKKYNCRTCSKSFSRSSLLHKHMDNGCGGATGIIRSL